jgi:hypothetical protein
MLSCGFAQLKPSPGYLMGQTLTLRLHYLQGQGVLQAKHAPWVIGGHILHPQLELTERCTQHLSFVRVPVVAGHRGLGLS